MHNIEVFYNFEAKISMLIIVYPKHENTNELLLFYNTLISCILLPLKYWIGYTYKERRYLI